MSAIFNFRSLLIVLLLITCTCSYVHAYMPSWLDNHKKGLRSVFYKFAIVGERLSPIISISLIAMACSVLLTD